MGTERYAACLVAARAGSRAALDALVQDLTPVVWHVARGEGLSRPQAEDVVQRVWLAALGHLHTIDDPQALLGWLITTTRREAKRVPATLDQVAAEPPDHVADLFWKAFSQLPTRCQELLRLMQLGRRSEYTIIADVLRMPRGMIGPTRGRCLRTLREVLDSLTFPVSIYLSDESGHERVESAVEEFLRSDGSSIVFREDPVLGSWFRRMRASAGSRVGQEVKTSAVHALESRLVLAQDASVTATMMQNLGPVLASLQATKDAVIRIGALLIVKVDWTVAVHQLTASQQLVLDHQPTLLTSPRDILDALNQSTNGHACSPSTDLEPRQTPPPEAR